MLLRRYSATTAGALAAAVTFALFELFGVDSLVYLRLFLGKVESLGADFLIGPAFLIAIGIFLDTLIGRRKHARQAEILELERQETIREHAYQAEKQEIARQTQIRELARQSELRELAHDSEIREQRLRVMQATMRTVQHIVNNFLNNLQLFRLDAEGLVDEASLKLIDTLSHQVATELTALGNLTETPEIESCVGVMIECEATRLVA